MKKILIVFVAIGLLTFVGCGNEGSGLTDADGTIYKCVIGKQEWMSHNLNVEHFRNGDIIPEVKTDEDWERAGEEKRPAWCYYENEKSNGEKYGKLYNWYAVNDPRGLAPEGWHVPIETEWTALIDYLSANGHDKEESKVLKSISGWGYDGNGTDDYGWNGLPGGLRGYNGDFNNIGSYGLWWSSSQYSVDDAWGRSLDYSYDVVYISYLSKKAGFSVRCLRD
tara:strand:- start:123 stop:791 length:669 start_codon:yes stop_codon:yes gene_type:complete